MNELKSAMEEVRQELIDFEQKLIRIPSRTCHEEDAARLVLAEMQKLGYDEAKIDSYGNVMGRMGDGPKKILFDAHLDVVDALDADEWEHGPFSGDIVDGEIWGRGTVDTKSSVVAMVYGAFLMKKLGYLEGKSIYVSASLMEEDYDGELLDRAMTENDLLHPAFAVIGEPSNLKIARGHRGRAMYVITTEGVSAHGSEPQTGVNAVYKMQDLIGRVDELNKQLQAGEGETGSVALTRIESRSASLNAVPDQCRIYLDRRLTLGESEDNVAEEMDKLITGTDAGWEVYSSSGTTWTGKEVVLRCFLPAWEEPEESLLTQTGIKAYKEVFGRVPELFKWNFATNGFACAGRYHVPTIGFGPGDYILAHQKNERCRLEDIIYASMFYAILVKML